jgi:hypothetical protein
MYSVLVSLISKLDSPAVNKTDIITWGAPVPSFGDPKNSLVATLGLNPSNREFVDQSGNELAGSSQRFHTLGSLGLRSWADADFNHIRLILETCQDYFSGNPYDRWFRVLDRTISGTEASYYEGKYKACHLDLIPYATAKKWTALSSEQRLSLIALAGDSLALLIRDSEIRILVLNGKAVVKRFQEITEKNLFEMHMPAWDLGIKSNRIIKGFSYIGTIQSLFDIALEKKILVLGYNHNLQSSFGVTKKVIREINGWISKNVKEEIR